LTQCQIVSKWTACGRCGEHMTKKIGRPSIDIAGQRFGRYVVIEPAESRDGAYWVCKCDCGNIRTVRGRTLFNGKSHGCGCANKDVQISARRADVTGQRFGYLVANELTLNPEKGMMQWLCMCDCGGTIFATVHYLRRGYIRSCGCKKVIGRPHVHGRSCTPEYRSWANMIHRCTNPKTIQYADYGGRGITVCKRWVETVENFITDMGSRPQGHSIDRINNDDGYHCGHCDDCKSHGWAANCRWATREEQASNKRKPKK